MARARSQRALNRRRDAPVGARSTPGLEVGLRHDGGDAETGTGVELGGRLSWADAGSGLGAEARCAG